MLFVHFSVDETRVALRPIQGIPGSDYINASFVDVCVSILSLKYDFVSLCFSVCLFMNQAEEKRSLKNYLKILFTVIVSYGVRAIIIKELVFANVDHIEPVTDWCLALFLHLHA